MLANNNEIHVGVRHQIEVRLQGVVYKMHKQQYNDRQRSLSLLLYYLVTLMLLANGYNVSLLIPGQLTYVAIYSVAVLLPIGLFLLRERVRWPLLMTNYTLLMLNLITDAFLPPARLYIAAAIYAGVIFLTNLIMLQEKKAVALVVLALIEAVLVQLKISGIITEDWNVVLTPLTVVEVCLFIALAILVILMILERCGRAQGRSALWFYNAGVKTALTSTHFMQLALPVAIVYFENFFVPVGVVIAIFLHHLAVILFVVYRREHIICSFCFPTQEVSVIQQNDAPSAFQKTIQRVSSHWFAVQQKPSLNPECASDAVLKQEQCLVCLTEKANMIWSPCGHLTTCEKCASYLVTHARLSCLLCKKQAKNLLKVDIEKPLIGQEYTVQRDITIVRAHVFR